MAVFTIVTTFADAVVASKRVKTSSSVLTRTVKTFVKIYNSNNRAKNKCFICLFVCLLQFFCEAFEKYKTIADLSHRLISIDHCLPKIYFLYCPLNMFLLKNHSIVGCEMIAYPKFQIVTTQLVQTRLVHGQSSKRETCQYLADRRL